MKLESLRIRENYGNRDQYVGEIEIKGEAGKLALVLNHEQCRKLLDVVADAMVETAKAVAMNLTAECITVAAERIEGPKA